MPSITIGMTPGDERTPRPPEGCYKGRDDAPLLRGWMRVSGCLRQRTLLGVLMRGRRSDLVRTKKTNRRDHERLERLNADICERLFDKSKQSMRIYRGDMRAIQWATWWIREVLRGQR